MEKELLEKIEQLNRDELLALRGYLDELMAEDPSRCGAQDDIGREAREVLRFAQDNRAEKGPSA